MSAKSLRDKVVELFHVCGTAQIIEHMVNNQGKIFQKEGVPEHKAQRILERIRARFGDRFIARTSSMMIEAGMTEEAVDAALEFYRGPGRKFLEVCQSPAWLDQLQKVCVEEMVETMKICQIEMFGE